MMLAGSDREREIGIAVRCADPCAIDARSSCGPEKAAIFRIILNEIDQRSARFRLFCAKASEVNKGGERRLS